MKGKDRKLWVWIDDAVVDADDLLHAEEIQHYIFIDATSQTSGLCQMCGEVNSAPAIFVSAKPNVERGKVGRAVCKCAAQSTVPQIDLRTDWLDGWVKQDGQLGVWPAAFYRICASWYARHRLGDLPKEVVLHQPQR